jgi:hypothetical protein
MSAAQPINVRDMAIVHRLFRQVYDEAARLVRAAPAPSPARVTFLADHIDLALAGLHSHHADEDALLYPKLIERAPEQAPMTEQVEHEVVQPHLDDEEQKVVPLAAVTLTQQEWDALGKAGMRSVPRRKRGIAAGMMLDALDDEERAYMLKSVPAPMRLLLPLMVERPWRKYAATLRTGT